MASSTSCSKISASRNLLRVDLDKSNCSTQLDRSVFKIADRGDHGTESFFLDTRANHQRSPAVPTEAEFIESGEDRRHRWHGVAVEITGYSSYEHSATGKRR